MKKISKMKINRIRREELYLKEEICNEGCEDGKPLVIHLRFHPFQQAINSWFGAVCVRLLWD
jgi:hypothetical protein